MQFTVVESLKGWRVVRFDSMTNEERARNFIVLRTLSVKTHSEQENVQSA